MRKIIVSEFVSLDGVMEAPDQWHFPFWHDEMGKYKYDELVASDALLLGRVTYEGFAAAWPTVTDEDGFADLMNGLPKYVVSSTLDEVGWNNSRLIKGDIAAEVAKIKEEPGRDILVAGSADLVNLLMRHDLIDEYRLMVHPVVVGHGKRLFAEGSAMKALRLVETTPLGPSVVVLPYQPADASSAIGIAASERERGGVARMRSDDTASDLPTDIGAPARRALAAAGYTRLDQFGEVSEAELLALHGVGPKGLDRLRRALAAEGLTFADVDRGGREPGAGSGGTDHPQRPRAPDFGG